MVAAPHGPLAGPREARAARRRMLACALALIPVTLLPWLGGALGPAYAAVAVMAGACFVARILGALSGCARRQDRRVFTGSLRYLSVLFAAVLADLALR